MREKYLPLAPPCLGQAEMDSVIEVLSEGEWLTSGPRTKKFEEAFRKQVQAPAALALNSCTAGLHLSMVVHSIGQGDEVITTPLTFCATANVIEHVGGTVRLADVDPETLLIDPEAIERAVTPRTRMIAPVHYAGQPCDMEWIDSLARARKLVVVEDGAHCLPSKIGERWIGSSDNLTSFSFYATKNITTAGEGGIITGRPDLIEEVRRVALHGMTRDAWNRFAKGGTWKYDVPSPGYKYNMTEIAASMGMAQLDRLDDLYSSRMAMVKTYNEAFANSKFLRPLKIRKGVQSSYHLYVILLSLDALTIDRDRFITELAERNIGSSVHYTPLHMLSYYSGKYGWRPDDFPNATEAFRRMISLPLSSKLTRQDAGDVIEAVGDICQKFER